LTSSGAYGSPNGFVWVAIDPAGKFAYLSDWGQQGQLPTYAVDTYSIDPMSGALTSVASIPADNSAFFSLDPSGKWGFTRSGASIGVFSVDVSTGTLTALGDYPNGAYIDSMAFIGVP
jgi:6-phosphogluconolactonase (cycloisomerase 2 family)